MIYLFHYKGNWHELWKYVWHKDGIYQFRCNLAYMQTNKSVANGSFCLKQHNIPLEQQGRSWEMAFCNNRLWAHRHKYITFRGNRIKQKRNSTYMCARVHALFINRKRRTAGWLCKYAYSVSQLVAGYSRFSFFNRDTAWDEKSISVVCFCKKHSAIIEV